MNKYQKLGHMTLIIKYENNTVPIYYLPHHSVERPDHITTKMRVVFDASAKTSTNVSLNDVLMVGPTIQPDIFTILLRFRKHNFVLFGDLAKMYRQILICK